MNIDDQLLARLETLAMIEIPADKKESIKKELGEVMSFVDNLNRLDVEKLEASASAMEGQTPLRADIPEGDETIPASILAQAPESREGYFIVPKIIE